MDKHNDRKRIENILREPLTRYRLFLNSLLRAAADEENPQPFTIEELKKFMAGIRENSPDYQKEVLNVLEAVQTGKAPQEPSFETPETQLIWGAALAYLKLNPDQMKQWKKPLEPDQLQQSDLWKQITDTREAYQELLTHAHYVQEALRDKNTKYGWGEPGSGFTFERQKNLINIDLMQSMIVGFEHARADVYREIGHSLLSVNYPKRMQEVYKEMRPLMKKQQLAQMKKGPKLKPDEYKKLMALSTEWQLRHMMFSAAEENVANKFVANMGQQMLQDYGVSLNNTAVTFRGVGLTRLPGGDNMSEDLRRYMNLCNTVQLSFFANSNLFDNTDDGWAKVGINPNLVRKTGTLAKRPEGQKDDADGISHPDFQQLRELCGGPKGLENLQPKQHERLYGWQNLTSRIERADADRKAIIEEIWKLYAEDLIQRILANANDQVEQKLKEAKNKKQQDGQDGDEDQDQDGQDGQEGQEGQEGQQGQKGQKGKKGQKGQKGQKQRGRPQGEQDDGDDSDDDGDDQDQDGQDQDGKDGKQKKDKKGQKDKKDKKGEKGEKQDGEGEDSEKQDGDDADADGQDGEKKEGKQKGKGKEGQLGQDEDETVPVEGAGDMPAPKSPTEAPADEVDPNGEANDGEGQDGDSQDADGEDGDDNGKTAEELEKELNKKEQEEGEEGQDGQDGEDGQDADGEGEDADGQKKGKGKKGKQKSRQAGHSDGESLEQLSKKDWTDYNRRIAELAGPISRVRKIFKDVQERQLQRKPAMSRTLDILPENGEVKDRFNAEAHRNLTIKKATGQVEEQDLKRFHKDEIKMVPTEIDIVILIDGSGSMNGTPLNSALQAAAIMFEAASGKDMKMNVYVGLWGSSDPPIIIRPGADRIKIGQEMEKARKGLNSGTDFAPAIVKVAETIGDQRGKSGTLSGFTHVLIISDGDIFDDSKSKEMIQTMFAYSDKVTFDTAIIGSKGTKMEQVSKNIKGTKPYHEFGVTIGNDPNQIPMEIVGLLLEKVRKCGSFVAVPNSQKRRAMKKAHNKMDPKR